MRTLCIRHDDKRGDVLDVSLWMTSFDFFARIIPVSDGDNCEDEISTSCIVRMAGRERSAVALCLSIEHNPTSWASERVPIEPSLELEKQCDVNSIRPSDSVDEEFVAEESGRLEVMSTFGN